MAHPSPVEQSPPAGTGYETRDANSIRLLLIGFGLLVLIVAVLAIIWGLFRFFGSQPAEPRNPSSALAREQVLPPEPRLQANPSLDLEQLRRRDDSILTTYGWVDRKAGIARIPIDTAINLMSHYPWPVRPGPDPAMEDRPR